MKNLVNIQNELKVPKGNFNSFGKYRYRSAEDILEAVKPILLKYDATLTVSDDIREVGSKVFLKAVATLTIGEQAISVCGLAETSEHKGMSAEQTTGTASSYARKYALNGLFLIDETEADADSQNNGNQSNQKPSVNPGNQKPPTNNPPPSAGSRNAILAEIKQLAEVKNVELKNIAYGMTKRTNNIDDLTFPELEKALDALKRK